VSYQDINIFTQIGFVVLVGLASKNAILIVEFAKHRREHGETPRQAALDACKLRFRPIVMTSFAFILGVVPLIVSHGAGAEMRQALGMAVFSGMLGVTLFGLALTPVFFSSIDWLGESRLFAWSGLRKISGFLLATLSLRPLRRLSVELATQIAAASRRKPKRKSNAAEKPASPPAVRGPALADETLILAVDTVESPLPAVAPNGASHHGASRPEFARQSKG
jgi:multidrug efflux pump